MCGSALIYVLCHFPGSRGVGVERAVSVSKIAQHMLIFYSQTLLRSHFITSFEHGVLGCVPYVRVDEVHTCWGYVTLRLCSQLVTAPRLEAWQPLASRTCQL